MKTVQVSELAWETLKRQSLDQRSPMALVVDRLLGLADPSPEKPGDRPPAEEGRPADPRPEPRVFYDDDPDAPTLRAVEGWHVPRLAPIPQPPTHRHQGVPVAVVDDHPDRPLAQRADGRVAFVPRAELAPLEPESEFVKSRASVPKRDTPPTPHPATTAAALQQEGTDRQRATVRTLVRNIPGLTTGAAVTKKRGAVAVNPDPEEI